MKTLRIIYHYILRPVTVTFAVILSFVPGTALLTYAFSDTNGKCDPSAGAGGAFFNIGLTVCLCSYLVPLFLNLIARLEKPLNYKLWPIKEEHKLENAKDEIEYLKGKLYWANQLIDGRDYYSDRERERSKNHFQDLVDESEAVYKRILAEKETCTVLEESISNTFKTKLIFK